jgi:hypothetical protein
VTSSSAATSDTIQAICVHEKTFSVARRLHHIGPLVQRREAVRAALAVVEPPHADAAGVYVSKPRLDICATFIGVSRSVPVV